MPIEIINLHPDGQSHWRCECQRVLSPEEAFKHALAGHECVFEVYMQGRWINDGWTVGDMVIMGKQQRGEDVQAFRERVKALASTEGVEHFAD